MFFSVSRPDDAIFGTISLYLDILNLLEDRYCLSTWLA